MKSAKENILKHTHNTNIDLLKLCACIGVIGLHTFKYDAAPILYYLCCFSVPVFFMVSGYFSLNKAIPTGEGYYIKKITSVLRIVILWNIIRFLISLSGILIGKNISEYSITYLITQILKSLLQKGKMWHFWYLGALILIYLFLFIFNGLYKTITLFYKNKVYFMFLLWGTAILCSIIIQAVSMFQGKSVQQHIIQTFRLWSWIQYFILGGLIPHIHPVLLKKISDKQHLLLLCIISIFIVGYQYTISNHILNTKFAEYFYDSIFVIIWVFILFTYAVRLHISAKWNKYISVFCPLTLGVYIVHPLVMSSIVGKLNSIPNYTAAICSFIIVLITSFTGVWALSKIRFIKKYLLTL